MYWRQAEQQDEFKVQSCKSHLEGSWNPLAHHCIVRPEAHALEKRERPARPHFPTNRDVITNEILRRRLKMKQYNI